jgi:archaemetzincin
MKIAIVLIERTVPGIRELMDAVRSEFNAKVIRDMVDLGATRAFRKQRNQYDAPVLLKELSRFRLDADFTLFIFREDLFAANLNFVFGIASGDMGIVSTTRLDPRFYGYTGDPAAAKELFKERLIKEALHELGHTLGLPHCEDKKCVMVFSNSIDDVDFKGAKFCEKCKAINLR